MPEEKKLNRSLGLGMVIIMVIANTIGSGVYKKVAPMAAELHSPGWVLLCWVLGGAITLLGALSNAEVAGLLAATGGEYAYYKKIYNRFFSFIYGWSLFTIIQTATISSLTFVFAQSVGGIFGLADEWFIKSVAIILILLLTALNSVGLKAGARLSLLVVGLVFLGIAAIVCFGLSSPAANLSQAISLETWGYPPPRFKSLLTAMLAAFWAYQGWGTIGFIGGEIKDARRNIPLGIMGGILVIILVYVLANITYMSVLSIPQLEAIHHSGNTIAAPEAVRLFWGEKGTIIISSLIALTTLGCTHANILTSCRTYYAMAQEGLFFRVAAKLNRFQVPSAALWFQGAWACVLVLSGTFDQLTDMIIFAVFIYYGATALGVFILRVKMPDAPRPYKVMGYPVVPALFILFCIALFFNTIIARPREAGTGMALILSGIPFYFWFNKRKI